MKQIWTQSTAAFDSEFVKFEPMMQWPKPVQKPHPPIVIGGAFPHAAKRAIAYGDGWIPIGGRALDPLEVLPQFRKMAKDAGRDLPPLGGHCWTAFVSAKKVPIC